MTLTSSLINSLNKPWLHEKGQHNKQSSKNDTRRLDLTRTHAKAHPLSPCWEPEQCLPTFWLYLFLSPWRCLPSLCTQKPTVYPCSLFLLKHLSWVIFLKQGATKINETEVWLKLGLGAGTYGLWSVDHSMEELVWGWKCWLVWLLWSEIYFSPPNILTYLFLNQPSSVWHINKMKNQIPYKACPTGQTIVICKT